MAPLSNVEVRGMVVEFVGRFKIHEGEMAYS